MLKTILLSLLCLSFSLPIYANNGKTVFTWVDEHGVLHFSDTPDSTDASAVKLQDFQPIPVELEELTPDFGDIDDLNQDDDITSNPEPKEKIIALALEITQPNNDEVIRSNDGNFTVSAELNRQLVPGEQLQLLLDNQPYHAPTTSPTWSLRNIDRGTHQLSIEAKQSGKQIASSPSITVHLQRAVVKKVKPQPKAL